MLKKIAFAGTGILLLASPLLVSAQSIDVQARIQALLAQIQQLQVLLAQLQSGQGTSDTGSFSDTATGSSQCIAITHNMGFGDTDASTGGDVTRLQRFLGSRYEDFPAPVGVFGPITQIAVRQWQSEHGIVSSGTPDTTGYGYVGPRTIEMIAASCAGLTGTGTANFNNPPTQSGAAPTCAIVPLTSTAAVGQSINFILQPVGATSYTFSPADGTVIGGDPDSLILSTVSGAKNVQFATAGSKTVSMTVTNASGQYTCTRTVTVGSTSASTPTITASVSGSTVTAVYTNMPAGAYITLVNQANGDVTDPGKDIQNDGTATISSVPAGTYILRVKELIVGAIDPIIADSAVFTVAAGATDTVSTVTTTNQFIPLPARDQVELMYIGYLGRAAEPTGLNYWVAQLNAGQTVAQIAQLVSASVEAGGVHAFYTAPATADKGAFIDKIYSNLYSRTPESAGKTYWLNDLTGRAGNTLGLGKFVLDVAYGAYSTDITTLQNKLAAANYFTTALTNAGITIGDSTIADAAASAVSSVTSVASTLTASRTATDAFVAGRVASAPACGSTVKIPAGSGGVKTLAVNMTGASGNTFTVSPSSWAIHSGRTFKVLNNTHATTLYTTTLTGSAGTANPSGPITYSGGGAVVLSMDFNPQNPIDLDVTVTCASTAASVPPTPTCSITALTSTASVGQSINFILQPVGATGYTFSAADGTVIGGDSDSLILSTVSGAKNVQFATAGSKTVSMTVTNASGQYTCTKTVTITTPNATPSISSITSASTFWSNMYSCVLGRAADTSGLNYYVGQTGTGIASLLAAYQNFYSSAEYAGRSTSNTDYVNSLYQCVLFRAPDTNANYWVSQLSGGASRDSVLQGFINSAEFQGTQGPALKNAAGFSSIASANTQMLSQLASALNAIIAILNSLK